MKLLLITLNKSCYETKRLIEEAKKQKIEIIVKQPNKVESINQFDAILFRSIQGQSKKAKQIAERAIQENKTIVDEKLGLKEASTKYGNYKKMIQANIPTPKTLLLPQALKKISFFNSQELVIKSTSGKQGKNITRIKNDLKELKKFFEKTPLNKRKKFMVSEFIKIEKEYRVFVIGDNAIAGFEKKTNNWIHNYSQGATPTPIKLTPELEQLAVKTTKVVKNEISGIDIAEANKKLFVIEANRSPGFKGLEEATNQNIAKQIIEYVKNKTKN